MPRMVPPCDHAHKTACHLRHLPPAQPCRPRRKPGLRIAPGLRQLRILELPAEQNRPLRATEEPNMANRFELVVEHDQVFFQLRAASGEVLLRSLGSSSKIMTQNEVLHLRRALQDPSHLHNHQGADGSHFVVIKEENGTVLAKSPHVSSLQHLEELTRTVLAICQKAPIVDLTKRVHAQGGHEH
jgi:hypothetical protein